ncbi:helix-turn-helix domain-containing protein [Spongiimicrobium salis]|uniref:helix-turn-helix domain-containing protein n=1 Tax=Spongiimicrobium salis TaxID=1667022 RepID=UPI00374DE89C
MNFIEQAKALILENLSNEHFGVSELADAMHMSRSNLLRKIKKDKNLSASQFIRQVRLEEAMELLRESSTTISEVSHQVGFGNTSYFTKCFREHYGYPPGEVGNNAVVAEKKNGKNTEEVFPISASWTKRFGWSVLGAVVLGIIILSFFFFNTKSSVSPIETEKSIAVLPFKNQSSDSSNLYFVNGLMESTLNKLQRIEELHVISRTSVEKYRNTEKRAPEIAEELQVSYLIEGSGQRVGNQILLNIQLIEAATDKSVWVKQYSQEVGDIFALQNEIAQQIAKAIAVKVTPAELEQIEKKPTENLVAYDYFLRALDPFYTRTKEGLNIAIPLFEKAIAEDPQFAEAHANLSMSYYFLDLSQKEKKYTGLINNYADKALLYDSKSDLSLIAKALYYMHTEEYRLALPHLEKALEYNPNSNAVVQVLSLVYANYIPDTSKYLKYALMGIQFDIAAKDSTTKSYIYLNLSNALIQNGFTEEAFNYINKSLDQDSTNFYAPYVNAFIQFAKSGDLERTKTLLQLEFEKDSTRMDILQEVAKLSYFQKDYTSAFAYYQKFAEVREKYGLNIYPQEDIRIAALYKKMGYPEQAADFFKAYSAYCDKDQSVYKSASTAMKYVYEGKYDEAIAELKVFAAQNHFQYWLVLFYEMDPLLEPLQRHPEYKTTMQKIKDRFWENHKQLKESLEEQKLL